MINKCKPDAIRIIFSIIAAAALVFVIGCSPKQIKEDAGTAGKTQVISNTISKTHMNLISPTLLITNDAANTPEAVTATPGPTFVISFEPTPAPTLESTPEPTLPPGVPSTNQMILERTVKFGTYNGEPILWRVIGMDETGVQLQTIKIICLKAYDAAESGVYESLGGTFNANPDVQKYGSNKWANSNLREWLNSQSAKVNFTTQAPIRKALFNGYNDYAGEAGFMTNFTQTQLQAVKPVNHDGTVDYFYILTAAEINKLNGNPKMPTAAAVANSDFKYGEVSADKFWTYWLRPVFTNTDSPGLELFYKYFENYTTIVNSAANGTGGIVPAVTLKLNRQITGTGTDDDPYMIVE